MLSATEAFYVNTECIPTVILCTFNPQHTLSAVNTMRCPDLCLMSSLSNNLFSTLFLIMVYHDTCPLRTTIMYFEPDLQTEVVVFRCLYKKVCL